MTIRRRHLRSQRQHWKGQPRIICCEGGAKKRGYRRCQGPGGAGKGFFKLAETQISYTVIYSPFSGVVLVKSAEVGEVVNPGTSVLTLADIENVWLKAYIPETDLGKIKWGQEVIVTTDLRPKKEYKGGFLSSPPRLNSPQKHSDGKGEGDLGLPYQDGHSNPDRELKPGMPADGKILLTSSPSQKP